MILLMTGLLWGCSNALEQYVGRDDLPPSHGVSSQPSTSTNAFKVSPGHGLANGSTIGARVTVTPTNRYVAGSTIGARISMQQQRAQ